MVLISKYIKNSTISHHFHFLCYQPSPSHHHPFQILTFSEMVSLLSPLSTDDLFMTQDRVIPLKHASPFTLSVILSLSFNGPSISFCTKYKSYCGLWVAHDVACCYCPTTIKLAPSTPSDTGMLALIRIHLAGVLYLPLTVSWHPHIHLTFYHTSFRLLLNSHLISEGFSGHLLGSNSLLH